MKKIPVSLIVDDPAPVISVYYTHCNPKITRDGREMIRNVPNSIFLDFCRVVSRRGIKGKFSVVPMPGNEGDIINGINGVDKKDLDEWMDALKKYLAPNFAIGPEMLTHNLAVDLETGKALDKNERDFAMDKDRTVLTPYVAKALDILKRAGIDSCGVTSPWDFGIEVEDEYVRSISDAVKEVYGKDNSWYFLRSLRNTPNAKPWVAYEDGERTVVSIPATLKDHTWQTINTTKNDDEFIRSVADLIINDDATAGEMIDVLNSGGYPILLAHWQSLVSNGLATGIRVLDLVAERINRNLSDRVEWMSFEQIMDLVIADKKSFPKPDFDNIIKFL